MDAGLQAVSDLTERCFDPVVLVYFEGLGQYVEDLPIQREGDGPGLAQDPLHVLLSDLLDTGQARLVPADSDHTRIVHAAYLFAGDSDVNAVHLRIGLGFGLLDGGLDGGDGLLDVDDQAPPKSAGGCPSNARQAPAAVGGGFGYHRADLGGSHVEGGDDAAVGCGAAIGISVGHFQEFLSSTTTCPS